MKSLSSIIILSFCFNWGYSQDYSIKGMVVDKESGNPVKNVNIVIAGQSRGTITDDSGYFNLDLDPNENIIIVSHVTYESQPVAIKETDRFIVIQFERKIYELPEIEISKQRNKLDVRNYEKVISTEDRPQPGQMLQTETIAEFPYLGGVATFLDFMELVFQYPVEKMTETNNGKAVFIFTIDKNGEYTSAGCLTGNENICDELKRILTILPKWKPAKQRGEPVEQTLELTVNF